MHCLNHRWIPQLFVDTTRRTVFAAPNVARFSVWTGRLKYAIVPTLAVGLIGLNAFLLFSVQPMLSKTLLPLLGGSAAVWSACVLFFQAVLLVGYLYAHFVVKARSTRRQIACHFTVLSVGTAVLFLTAGRLGSEPTPGAEVLWLVTQLAVTIGPAVLALSAGAPLLQFWLRGFGGSDTYWAYAASNTGSLLGLLTYPFLFEPRLTLEAQRSLWIVGFLALAGGYAGLWMLYGRATHSERGTLRHTESADAMSDSTSLRGLASKGAERISAKARFHWIVLSFAPAALLLALTHYLTVDIAPVPLLWVVPLALYLLTFVFAFAPQLAKLSEQFCSVQPYLLIVLAVLLCTGIRARSVLMLPLHLAAFATISLSCHLRLVERRPSPSAASEFYVFIALGGLAAGIFNVIVSPLVFNAFLEYPLLLLVGSALALRSSYAKQQPSHAADLVIPALAAALALVAFRTNYLAFLPPSISGYVAAGTTALVCATSVNRKLRYTLTIGGVLAVAALIDPRSGGKVLLAERSWYGAYKVTEYPRYRVLTHGTTSHGAQIRDVKHRRTPITYYHTESPVADAFSRLVSLPRPMRIVVMGLGTGTMACLARPQDEWTFLELDPAIVRIARDTTLFTFLADCAPQAQVLVGDARINFVRSTPTSVDVLVIDAFSSDAIPVHLITREAIRTYIERLDRAGLILVHISNRHLDLVPVLGAAAERAKLHGAVSVGRRIRNAELAYPSEWVALSPSMATISLLSQGGGWRELPKSSSRVEWMDGFSNVLSAVRWR